MQQFIRQAKDSQIEWSDIDREIGPDGTLGPPYGFHPQLKGPALEAQHICLGFKGDGVVLRAAVIPELLSALHDPERFAVAHLTMCELFRPNEVGRLTPTGPDAFIWADDGLRVQVRVLRRSGMGSRGNNEFETYSVSAKIDCSTAPALAEQWSRRHENGELLGHF